MQTTFKNMEAIIIARKKGRTMGRVGGHNHFCHISRTVFQRDAGGVGGS